MTAAPPPDLLGPWPPLFGRPVCTIRVGAPADAALAVLAEDLEHAGLRVRRGDRSLEVRSARALVRTVVGVVGGLVSGSGGDSFSSPVFTVTVLAERPDGVDLEAGLRSGQGGDLRHVVPAALSAGLRRLWGGGAAVSAGPWDRWGRGGRRYPVGSDDAAGG